MIKNLPISEDQLLQQVKLEREEGENFVNTKRTKFRQRLELYNNISGDDKKIYARLIYTVMQTLLGVSYSDEMTVRFAGRQMQDDELADNIQNLAKFDHDEMELDKINYQKEWDRLFYGVGIRVLDYWDTDRRVPVFKVMDPLSWIPDPYGTVQDGFRYHGFELEVGAAQLTDDVFHNLDKIEASGTGELEKTKNKINEVRELNDTKKDKADDENPVYKIYNHYTTIVDPETKLTRKYLVTLANDCGLVIRAEEIQAVTKAEEENPGVIPYPVVLNYYSPMRGDPFGVCIPDLLEDKQKAEQLFLNLNRIKAENEAWGDYFLYDSGSIKNINELKVPSQGPKFLKADLRANPNPIQEVRKAQVKGDAVNIPQLIQQQAQMDLGLDARSLGVGGATNITATENQRIQQNANIRLLLGNKINQWGEKEFWNQWFRSYKEYFKPTDKKNILLNNAFGSQIYTVKLTDIKTEEDINITVVNKSDEEAITEKERLGFLATAPMILQDPNTPAISRAFAQRKMLKLNGMDKDETMVMVPPSIEEMQAMEDVNLLNEDEMPGPIESLTEDHLTYIIIYKRALDTPAKAKAIAMRQEALIASGQAQQAQLQGGVQGALAAGGAAQIQAKALQEAPVEAASLEQVTA